MTAFRRCFVLLAPLSLVGAANQPLRAAEQYAFLVGVSDYDAKQLKPLTYARADIVEFRDVLVESGFKPENVVLMHDDLRTLSRPRLLAEADKIRTELRLLTSVLEPEDALIVAFTGHGVQFKGEQEHYFCPHDAVLGDPLRTCSASSARMTPSRSH